MSRRVRKSSGFPGEHFEGRRRFEHWYRDNQVYFITARCRDRFPALASEQAKATFWDRFTFHSAQARFEPWIASVMDNHYHLVGWCEIGDNLGTMMQRIHGSVAKLVNDLLSERRVPFWRGPGDHDYFDGCLRDETQYRRAYRYTMLQSVRHGLCRDWRKHAHTRVYVELEEGLRFALIHRSFLNSVPYKRYENPG